MIFNILLLFLNKSWLLFIFDYQKGDVLPNLVHNFIQKFFLYVTRI